ncbi:hypothetical protein PUR59_00100 [Streptomyces sp. SP18ES09]|nr:hypothetical protein [Streptomyces sp. SP18ES09]MEE1813469.1 hypothetical protein [Streptomyces sp. SP18ES09]
MRFRTVPADPRARIQVAADVHVALLRRLKGAHHSNTNPTERRVGS